MARTLLEALEEAQKKAEEKAIPQAGATQRAQQQAQAFTGRKVQRGVALSTQQENIARQQAIEAQEQRSYATQIFQEQARLQEEQTALQQQQQTTELENRRLDSQLELQQRTADMLQQLNAKRDQLSTNRLKSNAELTAQMLRISNGRYVDQLNAEAMKSRLDNEAAFMEALEASVFQDSIDLLRTDLDMQAMLRADERQFKDYLSGIQLDDALLTALLEQDAASTGAIFSGVSQAAVGGIQAYGAYESQQQQIAREKRLAGLPREPQ